MFSNTLFILAAAFSSSLTVPAIKIRSTPRKPQRLPRLRLRPDGRIRRRMQQLHAQLVQKDGVGQPAGEGCAQRGAEGAAVGDFEEDGEGWVGIWGCGRGLVKRCWREGEGVSLRWRSCWLVGGLTVCLRLSWVPASCFLGGVCVLSDQFLSIGTLRAWAAGFFLVREGGMRS